jgi:glutamyl-Q tRNA(Asp) synthetase
VLAALRGRGLLYPCFCTRADIRRELAAPHDTPDGPRYPGTCRHLPDAVRAERMAAGQPYALRLDMAAALAAAPGPLRFHDATAGQVSADPSAFGDIVLARKDTPASYHLCVTHDDARQGVNLVVRGDDLLAATHVHVLLQALMGWPTPDYAHHRLLTDAAGRRLAKRDRAATLRDLRAGGHSPAEVRAMAMPA